MKRRVVQHGPKTLTISLPARWAREYGIEKGDEINLEKTEHGLLLSTMNGRRLAQIQLDLRGLKEAISRVIAASYKSGHDEIIATYATPGELEEIHRVLGITCVGFEIIEETDTAVHIHNVSEPAREEFKALFRRLFFFLLTTADECLAAARNHDATAYKKLVIRDWNINKLADFCRRIINKHGQDIFKSDTATYHVVEQLEKIGDRYKEICLLLAEQKRKPDHRFLAALENANELLRAYETLLFHFTLKEFATFLERTTRARRKERTSQEIGLSLIDEVIREIDDLKGATLTMQL